MRKAARMPQLMTIDVRQPARNARALRHPLASSVPS
jgi:hypothetical protein